MPVAATAACADQRLHRRAIIALSGRLFVPAEDITIACGIVNLSAGGAGVKCDEPPPLNAFVVLYIDGFGRFDCVASRFVKGELGLRFVCKEDKRQRLMDNLAAYVHSGVARKTRLRAHPRLTSDVKKHFTQADGTTVPAQVVDFSIQGMSLRTTARPVLGEVISMGRTHGRVMRHLDDGIAVQFIEISESTDHGR